MQTIILPKVKQYIRRMPLGVVLLVAVSVVFGFAIANAAVTHIKFEAESGTALSNASIFTDSTASGGQGVQFTSTPPSGGCSLPAYPDQTCTGVPTGTTLTNYTGPTDINTANTIIDSKNITSCIRVSAPGVIIRKSKIACNSGYVIYNQDGGYSGNGLLIEDTEITCNNNGGTAIGEANLTARRLNIHGCENGFDMNQKITVEDSYIHDMYNEGEAHTDGIQLASRVVNGSIIQGAKDIIIRHNTIYGMGADGSFGTSAIISNQLGDVNILVEDNLLAGGAATLYCTQDGTAVNYRVFRNHFSTRFKSTVGSFFPSTGCSDEILSGNVYHESGQPINLD